MILYPAIDILDGKAVRLRRGEFQDLTVFDDDPVNAARRWVEQGAQWLHLVDLAGAKDGTPVHRDVILAIRKEFPQVQIEVGGGIRDRATMLSYLDGGVDRIIFGTSALQDPNLLRAALGIYADRVAVSLDARGGYVAIKGWTSLSKITVADAVKQLKDMGLQTLIYTDIGRDGMMGGPNIEGLQEVAGCFGRDLIASGGITTLDDLRALAQLQSYRVTGAIVGRALYENAFTLTEALAAVAEQ